MRGEKSCSLLKAFLISVFSFCILFLIVGCESTPGPTQARLEPISLAQKAPLPECSGGIVLTVAGQTITSDQIIGTSMQVLGPVARDGNFAQFETQARPHLKKLLESKIADILLYSQARKDTSDNMDQALEKAAQAEVDKFIADFGGNYAEAEALLKRMGLNWQSFKEDRRKRILVQSYVAGQLPDDEPIKHSELLDHYEAIKAEHFLLTPAIQFRLIDIQPTRLAFEGNFSASHNPATDLDQDYRRCPKALAAELLRRIKAGEDFAALAQRYSHGHRAPHGGLWSPVQTGSLAEPYDVLEAAARNLEPGQIAGPIQAQGHIFIMKLEEKHLRRFEPFEKVQQKVQADLILRRRIQAADKLLAKLRNQARACDTDKFVDFCLQKIYRQYNK